MFWLDNPIKVLFGGDEFYKFFPTMEMNVIEKLNAIVRLSVYLGIVLFFISNNLNYLFLPIVVAAFTIFIYKYHKNSLELYFNSYNELEDYTEKIGCTQPSPNNPFMNINLITDPKNKPRACKPNEEIKEKIEDNFNINLFRDVSDVYGKNNSQRQYYTMPATTIPNDQTKFAKWLYGQGPTCKEKTMFCATPWNPETYAEP
jgi:hypothetical protein